MQQNIYDNPVFFAGYKALRRNDTGLNGALEVPALRAVLPELGGLRVLDLGCGFGDFARFARGAGAVSVVAIDASKSMIAEAAQLTNDPGITYLVNGIEDATFASRSFDLIVSSMALHYVSDYEAAVRRIFRALEPEGAFVFSVEHPICTANPVGWVNGSAGDAQHWPVDRYQDEGKRETNWFVEGVTKFHRTIETYVSTLLAAGFRLDHLGEPRPVEEALAKRPELAKELRRPPILVLGATKMKE
ncbi:class I SAM-dependent methyltransferase [Mesorhizobium loti]|nr:class I SAM-dependent methyltransferase [Mesorhizobium loti]